MQPASALDCRAIKRWRSIATPTIAFWVNAASRSPAPWIATSTQRASRSHRKRRSVRTNWLVMREPDLRVVEGARERFEPAIPLTIAGGVMALIGAFIGWLLGRGSAGTVKATGKMLRGATKAGLRQRLAVEQLVEPGLIHANEGWAPVIALRGGGHLLHLAQQRIHFINLQSAPGTD